MMSMRLADVFVEICADCMHGRFGLVSVHFYKSQI